MVSQPGTCTDRLLLDCRVLQLLIAVIPALTAGVQHARM